MILRVGTSGFSYKEWKGSFYPEDLPQSKFLSYYGEHFKTVEINNTFYRMPKPELLEGWASQVGDDFRFVLKASRRITHQGRLKDVGDNVRYLYDVAATLGERLGPVLFQLPPYLKCDVERLRGFLATLPEGARAAMEFRDASWHDNAVFDALREHGVALCIAETPDDATPFESTADWGYLRLRKVAYEAGELEAWADRVREAGWREAYVFFKHEDEGTGPALGKRFEEIAAARTSP
ncbi:MAG TPA: DUF72 domain-containing protein [Longimicrobiales bacterium]|nr:DUF72 domain-containing protein [Longimicrobiales bacterium]